MHCENWQATSVGSVILENARIIGRYEHFILNKQPVAIIIQIYYVIKLYMLRASSLPIIRSLLLYIRHW